MGKRADLDPKKMREAIIAQLQDPHFSDDDQEPVKGPKKKPKQPGQDS